MRFSLNKLHCTFKLSWSYLWPFFSMPWWWTFLSITRYFPCWFLQMTTPITSYSFLFWLWYFHATVDTSFLFSASTSLCTLCPRTGIPAVHKLIKKANCISLVKIQILPINLVLEQPSTNQTLLWKESLSSNGQPIKHFYEKKVEAVMVNQSNTFMKRKFKQ